MKANFRFSFGRGLNLYAANKLGNRNYTKYEIRLHATKVRYSHHAVTPLAFVFLEFQAQCLPYFHHKDNFREMTRKQTDRIIFNYTQL
jgi:hypothetical protein